MTHTLDVYIDGGSGKAMPPKPCGHTTLHHPAGIVYTQTGAVTVRRFEAGSAGDADMAIWRK